MKLKLPPSQTLTKGTRVLTPRGMGRVAYVRMAPPEYREPEAVSVVLDQERERPGYTGTIFAAQYVTNTKEQT